MNDEWEQDFLDRAEILRRVAAFGKETHSIDCAADHGLLALSVPTRFGGLYVNRGMWWWATQMIRKRTSKMLSDQIAAHLTASRLILNFGSFAQYDKYLPQFAAGKCLSTIATQMSGDFHVKRRQDGFVLTGGGYTASKIVDYLVVHHVPYKGHKPEMDVQDSIVLVIPSHVLPAYYFTRRRSGIRFNDYFVPAAMALNGLPRVVNWGTEKWEAIRWRTDQSV